MTPYRSYNLEVRRLGPRISAKESFEKLRDKNRILLAFSSFSMGIAVLTMFGQIESATARWVNLLFLATYLLRVRENHRNYKRLASVVMRRFKRKLGSGTCTVEDVDEMRRMLA